jgi:Cu(I)/Ag(I) efflux system membrane fusion protein
MFATVTLTTPVADSPAFRSRWAKAHAASADPTHLADLTAEEQKVCPVTAAKLGSMGAPVSVRIQGRMIWTCCGACPPKIEASPARYIARLDPTPRDAVLSVPEAAVVDTGVRKVVYVESEPGVFEGREVVLGPLSGSRYPVLEGLAPGEKVAAAGAFLIDAETRLNPAAAGAGVPAPDAHAHPPARPDPKPQTRQRGTDELPTRSASTAGIKPVR